MVRRTSQKLEGEKKSRSMSHVHVDSRNVYVEAPETKKYIVTRDLAVNYCSRCDYEKALRVHVRTSLLSLDWASSSAVQRPLFAFAGFPDRIRASGHAPR